MKGLPLADIINPLVILAMKSKVGQDYADEAELFVLIHFDAAKRGKLGPIGYNFISRHLVMAQYIFARLKNPKLLALQQAAGVAWQQAGARPTEHLDLTTGEYLTVRIALAVYFKAVPKIEAGTYRQACNVAERAMEMSL